MTAIECMKQELSRILHSQQECITEAGFIKSGFTYRFNLLTQKARAFKEAIDWMESLYSEKGKA